MFVIIIIFIYFTNIYLISLNKRFLIAKLKRNVTRIAYWIYISFSEYILIRFVVIVNDAFIFFPYVCRAKYIDANIKIIVSTGTNLSIFRFIRVLCID